MFFIFGIVGVQLWAGFLLLLSSSDSHNSPLFVFTPEIIIFDCTTNLAGLLRQRCYINETYQRHLIGLEGFQE